MKIKYNPFAKAFLDAKERPDSIYSRESATCGGWYFPNSFTASPTSYTNSEKYTAAITNKTSYRTTPYPTQKLTPVRVVNKHSPPSNHSPQYNQNATPSKTYCTKAYDLCCNKLCLLPPIYFVTKRLYSFGSNKFIIFLYISFVDVATVYINHIWCFLLDKSNDSECWKYFITYTIYRNSKYFANKISKFALCYSITISNLSSFNASKSTAISGA